MRILIAGSSGLVGSALAKFLRGKGHEVTSLSRRPAENAIVWNPESNALDSSAIEGFDVFINLAGENIASGRWTETKKRKILESRLQTTTLLVDALSRLQRPPQLLINASAIGFYGDRGDTIVDEESPRGSGFLADVCAQWEAAASRAAAGGVRVVLLRIGVVLSREGGALANMLTPFKLCLGGRIGTGSQYMSWITLNELVHVIDFVIRNPALEGPVNAVAPCPVTNAEFTKALGKALKRPTILPMPAFAARLAFGELADELLLSSIRVHPTKLQKAGYSYCDPHLAGALRKELR